MRPGEVERRRNRCPRDGVEPHGEVRSPERGTGNVLFPWEGKAWPREGAATTGERVVPDARGTQELSSREEGAGAGSLHLLGRMLDSAHDPVLIWRIGDGRILYWNRGAERLYGYSSREARVREVHGLLRTVFPRPLEEILRKLREEGRWDGELLAVRRGGERVGVNSRWTLGYDEDGAPACVLEIDSDVGARKRAEDALRDSEDLYRSFIRGFRGIAYRSDLDMRPLFFHGAVERITGYAEEDLVSCRPGWRTLVHPDDRLSVERNLEKARTTPGFAVDHRYRILRRDGGQRWVHEIVQNLCDAEGRPVLLQGVIHDVSEQKATEDALNASEAQLRQSQKMEAVGRLAGGIAHDFNNLLVAINGYSELLLSRIPEGDRAHRDAEEIRKAGERAAGLVRQLLAFSRRQVLQPKVISLNDVVSSMENLLRRLIGEDIDLVIVLSGEPVTVRADPGQIEQVIVNLAVNARDAMPGGGVLTLETAHVDAGRPAYFSRYGIPSASYAMLSVGDTGSGMSEEAMSHLFEPFFTTKEKGKGTGLGLSTVYGIVKQSGGHIGVESEPGTGTTFRIHLPRVDAPQGEAAAEAARTASLARGKETILLVEDEDAVRDLVRDILRMNGYTVLAARNGPEALDIGRRHEGGIALVLTDVVMPRMSGYELARILMRRRPETKVLFMSGHTEEGETSTGGPHIRKPFTLDALARRIREVLDGSEK